MAQLDWLFTPYLIKKKRINEMNSTFIELNNKELEIANGGGVGGAVAGGILGGTAGLFIYTIDACFTGEASFNGIWKSYTAGALTGAGIGVWFPV